MDSSMILLNEVGKIIHSIVDDFVFNWKSSPHHVCAAEIETVFMPWLMTESGKIMDKQIVARQLLDGNYYN